MRFLIDECLSTRLVSVARQVGHDAQHVAHVGKAGWKTEAFQNRLKTHPQAGRKKLWLSDVSDEFLDLIFLDRIEQLRQLDLRHLRQLGEEVLQLLLHLVGELVRVDAGRQAADLTPPGHPRLAIYLSNLGTALHTRFERAGDSADLDDASTKSCKRMADVGFGELDGGDVDVRAAWRDRLEREGKLNPGSSVADLVLGPAESRQ